MPEATAETTNETTTANESGLNLTFVVDVKNPETGKINKVEIVSGEVERGRSQGNARLEPKDLSDITVDRLIELYGQKLVTKVFVLPKIKQLCTSFTREALTHTEVVDGKKIVSIEQDEAAIKDEFSRLFAILSSRGESLVALKRKKNELIAEMGKLADQLVDLKDDDIEGMMKLKGKIREFRTELEEVNKSIEEKKASDDDSEDDDKNDAPAATQPVAA